MKEKKKKVTLYITLGIIAIGIIALTVTYAYWRLTKEQTKKDVLQTGCFNINFTGENDITLNKAYPMKPDELENFLSTETPYHFTIENTCDNLATATINLESLNAGAEKQLNDEYIDAILYETDYHNNLNSEKQLNESMYNDENKVIKESLHAYELYNFTLQKGETKSFNLLLYMDADTPMETANMNASWKGKITLSTNYKEEPTANLNGLIVPVVENGDGLYAVSHEVSEISTDWNKTEYRYAGANVNNYVSFNNEIWRVIGKVNVQTDSGIEQRLKIIRQDGIEGQKSFDKYYWDSNTNNWTTSSLKNILNGLYYNSTSGDCHIRSSTVEQCDFTGNGDSLKGLSESAQNMIDKEIIWNIGGWNTANITSNTMYEKERGTGTLKDYPVEWSSENDELYNGIGLMYPSDYGYAVGEDKREICLKNNLYDYRTNNCYLSNWLKIDDIQWTITMDINPSNYTSMVYEIESTGGIYSSRNIRDASITSPTLYLKSSVKITPNPNSEQEYGTIDNPFQLIDTSL